MQHLSRRFSGYAYLYIAIASFATQTIIALMSSGMFGYPPRNVAFTVIKLVFMLAVFVPPLVMAAMRKYPVAQVLRLNTFQAKYAWYAIGIGICLNLFVRPFNFLFIKAFNAIIFPQLPAQLIFSNASPHLWPYVLTSCLIPAFFETMAFQGVVQSGLHDAKPLKACLMVGFLFGLLRVGSNAAMGEALFATAGYTVFGFTLSYIAVRSGSILPAMIASFTFYLCNYADLRNILYQYLLSPLGINDHVAALCILALALVAGGLLIIKMPRAKEAGNPLRLPSFREFRQRLTQPYIPSPDEDEPDAIAEAAPEPAASKLVDPLREAANAAGDTAKNKNVGFIVGGILLAALSLAVLVGGIVMFAIHYSDIMY